MNKNTIVITGSADEIAVGLQKLIDANSRKKSPTEDFEKERLTRSQVLKLLDVSFPTLKKYIDSGLIPAHGTGKKKFFFRSEIIEAVRNMDSKK